jgi:hypothetical protein
LNNDLIAPRLLNPFLPGDLETVSLKCPEKDLPRRYATTQPVADELRRFPDGEPVLARPVGMAAKAWRRSQCQLVRAGLAAALILAQELVTLHELSSRLMGEAEKRTKLWVDAFLPAPTGVLTRWRDCGNFPPCTH